MSNKQTLNKAGPGRPKGSQNKTTATLKEAILAAAKATGEDGKGRGGLTGYLKHVAQTDVKAFSALLGKVLPMQVTGANDGPIAVTMIELVAPAHVDSES